LNLGGVKFVKELIMKLTGHDIGHPAQKGDTLSVGTSGYDLTAGGADIWEFSDQFHFACDWHEGNFDGRVRVESLEEGHPYTKAGLMVRESLDPGSPHFYHVVFPDNRLRNNNSGGHESQYRLTQGGASTAIYPADKTKQPPRFPVNYPDVWIRVTRRGAVFEAFSGSDGVNWTLFARHEQTLPRRVLIGLAVTSHDDTKVVRARFREFEIDPA
jgi:hypothetical protein